MDTFNFQVKIVTMPHHFESLHTGYLLDNTYNSTVNSILQPSALHQETRTQLWPNGATLEEKLWGPKSELNRITDFISSIGLDFISSIGLEV